MEAAIMVSIFLWNILVKDGKKKLEKVEAKIIREGRNNTSHPKVACILLKQLAVLIIILLE
jgi:hypothetical protein